jgi:GMP synthase (glutamine-hydrolysing)
MNFGRESIAILDFGSQYSQLIARRVREAHVYCELLPHDASWSDVAALEPRGIILSGGPASVYDQGAPSLPDWVLTCGLPVLGICYGLQLIVQALGGAVEAAARREYGQASVNVDDPDQIFSGLPLNLSVWMSHGDRVTRLPEGFRVLAHSGNSPVAAIGDEKRGVYGLQFHPEVAHTPLGAAIIGGFLSHVCGCQGTWTPASFVQDAVQSIAVQVGNGRVLCGLSGGVDSSVVAALVGRAVGDRLTCVFVDNGLLREGEANQVRETFQQHLGLNLTTVNAGDRFLAALKGVVDPERKRKIIGEIFVRVFEDSAASAGGNFDFLAQGTLYPDVIESAGAGKAAARIKTHHNVGGLPEDLRFALVEPLRFLFKDEVRAVGKELGLPDQIVGRHPFPGPGLAVRVIGEVTPERLAVLRAADAIFVDELRAFGEYDRVWQALAVLTPLQSVGVMGDGRTYASLVALRAVTSQDGMTADWARLPADLLARVSSRVVNEVPGVNRVVYDITSKPPATIEWE